MPQHDFNALIEAQDTRTLATWAYSVKQEFVDAGQTEVWYDNVRHAISLLQDRNAAFDACRFLWACEGKIDPA